MPFIIIFFNLGGLFHILNTYTFKVKTISMRVSLCLFSSVAQSCPTVCDPVDCSMPGFPVHHQLPELVQTHVHQVDDIIQPFYPLLSNSPPVFNIFQHQGLFK